MNNTSSVGNASKGTGCPNTGHPTETGMTALGSLYIVMTVVSLIGNILVVCTVVFNRRMRTVTNYLIVNMAVADLLLTVFNMTSTTTAFLSPQKSWLAGDIGIAICKLIPFIQSLSVGTTVLNMTVIAIDRFFAVIFPLRRYVTFSVAYVMMAIVWISASAVSAPILYAMNIIQFTKDGPLYCWEDWNLPLHLLAKSSAPKDFTIALFLFFYAIPLAIMTVLYSIIIHKLWIRKVPGQRSEANEQQVDKSKKKVLRMLLVVVLVFAICWLPIHISQFIIFYGDPCGPPKPFLYAGFFLGHANSALNPFLYALFNENYRKGFRDLLMCRCCRRRVIPGSTMTVGYDNTYIDKNSFRLNITSPAISNRVNPAYCNS